MHLTPWLDDLRFPIFAIFASKLRRNLHAQSVRFLIQIFLWWRVAVLRMIKPLTSGDGTMKFDNSLAGYLP
jgi:hypothetical protein